MNITPRIKSHRSKPQYVLNVSIEIPLNTKYAITHRSQQTSLTPSPNRMNKKYKLSITPANQRKTMNTSNMPTLRDVLSYAPSRKKNSERGSKILTKSKDNGKLRPKKQKQKKITRNVSILQQVVEDEDNMIKYTSHSSEMKGLEDTTNIKIVTNISQDIDIGQIRQMEKQLYDKKEHLNYMYLKEKILVLASAKKIQRAWRNYKTKKLIKSYSHDIRLKLTKSLQSHHEDNLLTVRSLGRGLKFKKNDFHSNLEDPSQKPKQQINAKLKKFQEESIQMWEELIYQIKEGKNLHNVLENSERRREQLKNELGQQKIIKTKNYYESIKERKEIKPKSLSSEGEETAQRKQRINYFQNEILKIDNDLSQNSNSARKISSFEANWEMEEEQNLKLRKKLELFSSHFVQLTNEEQPQKEIKRQYQHRIGISDLVKKKLKKQLDSVLEASAPIQLQTPPLPTYRSHSPEPAQNFKSLGEILQKQPENLMQTILQELILESLIQISESQKIIQGIKNLLDQQKTQQRYKKPEGIVTGLPSVRDYINFFLSYLAESKLDATVESSLNKPIGPTAEDLFRYFRGQDVAQSDSEYVMSIDLFNKHWDYASELIYFDRKFQDEKKENQRVTYLKQLTKVFFRAIFDCFNQSLEIQRIYGLTGRPYPWTLHKPDAKKPVLKQALSAAFRRVLRIAVVFCGVHFQDKEHSLDNFTISQIQEQSMNKLLTMEAREQEYMWSFYEDDQAELRLEIAQFIEQSLIKELQFFLSFKSIK